MCTAAWTDPDRKWGQFFGTVLSLFLDTGVTTDPGVNRDDVEIRVRGHTLVWSVEERIQDWVKQLEGQQLRDAVEAHITEKMNITAGLLEHWDVNNEILHGQWFQDRLNDPDYNLETFRIAHSADPSMKLFLNDFNVVSAGWSTSAYRLQGQQFKDADVGLYGMGAQCHFGDETEPSPALIKQRLDSLSSVGVPIWATELDVSAQDENTRADYYERALRALYGHPAVEGILVWGFWDQSHWRGENSALAKGDNMELF
nr:hypothetical protein BaRGS_017918 [Batillaria attramentaria]